MDEELAIALSYQGYLIPRLVKIRKEQILLERELGSFMAEMKEAGIARNVKLGDLLSLVNDEAERQNKNEKTYSKCVSIMSCGDIDINGTIDNLRAAIIGDMVEKDTEIQD